MYGNAHVVAEIMGKEFHGGKQLGYVDERGPPPPADAWQDNTTDSLLPDQTPREVLHENLAHAEEGEQAFDDRQPIDPIVSEEIHVKRALVKDEESISPVRKRAHVDAAADLEEGAHQAEAQESPFDPEADHGLFGMQTQGLLGGHAPFGSPGDVENKRGVVADEGSNVAPSGENDDDDDQLPPLVESSDDEDDSYAKYKPRVRAKRSALQKA